MRIIDLYRRSFGFIIALPLLAAVPFCAELLQHAVETSLGMFQAGVLTPQGQRWRALFGLIKLAGIVVIILAAMRFWRFGGDRRRALRPNGRMALGLVAFVLLQLVEFAIAGLIKAGVERSIDLHAAPLGVRFAVLFGPTIVWTFVAGLWLPWLVAMLVDDPAMTLRRSLAAARGRLWAYFGLIVAGVVPLMTLHYVLAYGAIGRPPAVVWTLNIVDAAVVVVLSVCVASSFYGVYALAEDVSSERRSSPRFRGEGDRAA